MYSKDNLITFLDKRKHPIPQLPRIFFDEGTGFLRIEGEAFHERVIEQFQLLITVLKKFLKQEPTPKLIADFSLLYFNTSSKRCLFEIFQLFESHHKQSGEVYVYWHYSEDNFDIFDSGVEFRFQVTFDFWCLPVPTKLQMN